MSERMVGIVPERFAPPGMRNNGIVRDFAADLVAMHEAGKWVDPVRLKAAESILARACAEDVAEIA